MARKNLLVCFIFILLVISCSQAQVNILNKEIAFEYNGIPLSEALTDIAEKGDFFIAYSPSILPEKKRVSIASSHATVKEGLNKVLEGTSLKYKLLGDHIILQKQAARKNNLPESRPKTPSSPAVPSFVYIRGKVRDNYSKKGLGNAIIMEENDKFKPIYTNDEGRFEIKLARKDSFSLLIYKENFHPTRHQVHSSLDQEIGIIELKNFTVANISDRMVRTELAVPINPLSEVLWVRFLVNDSLMEAVESKKGVVPLQLSFLPRIGTHWLQGKHDLGGISVNLIAGYAHSLKGLEVGGCLNAIRQDMSGLQIAGMANVVGGSVNGLQAAGGFNLNFSYFRGMQVAGFFNAASQMKAGLQIAGAANLLRGSMNGAQIAGAINLSPGDINGLQISGFSSLSWGRMRGAQISGALNLGGDVQGMQMAGLLNIAGNMRGFQLAPINVGINVSGFQLGIINIADSVSRAPIGLINIVRKGYQGIEFGADEWWPLQGTIRMGVPRYYTIVQVLYNPRNPYSNLGYSAGMGLMLTARRPMQWKLEGLYSSFLGNRINGQRIQLRTGAEWPFGRHFYAAFGPSVNYYSSFSGVALDGLEDGLPYALWKGFGNSSSFRQVWVGFYVGIGFKKNHALSKGR
ncbi:MAG: STN domain-containing protein [Bacteroidia bacterium]|nr:STN domain-containing protein [Bacteroidia bacterium]